jgi:DNA-binding transcriptional LysR family regulator
MFTEIYPSLHRTLPNLEVRPVEMRVRAQQTAIAREELDIGFMTLLEEDRTNDTYLTLAKEELVLIIPSGHPLAAKAAPHGMPLASMDIRDLRYEPFVLMDKDSTLRSVCDAVFSEVDVIPRILFETNNTGGIVSMVESTLCCGIIPQYYVREPSDRIACFSLTSRPVWDIAISYRKNRYLSSGAKEFIRLAREYCEFSD